jgi:hypothetical protein
LGSQSPEHAGGVYGCAATERPSAQRARPELLILHSESEASEEELLRQIRALYRGRFVLGHDLDVF